MHLLDTNILTAFYLGNPKVLTALGKLEDSQVTITIVTKVELLRGRIDHLLKTERGEAVLRARRYSGMMGVINCRLSRKRCF
jgi:tRNA(fMet)-specific endonuclease VapC